MTTAEPPPDKDTTRGDDTVPLSRPAEPATTRWAPPSPAVRSPVPPPAAATAPLTPPGTSRPAAPPGDSGGGHRRASSSRLVAVSASGVEGVPERYPDGFDWLKNGLRRHPWAVGVGLVTGWTGVWFALWVAAAGLLLGALVVLGLFGNTGVGIFLFHIGAGQAVTVVGVVVGGILGAVGGFLIVPKVIFIDHPLSLLVSLASGALLTGVLVVLNAVYERPLLRFRGYRRLSRDEVRRIAPLVKTVGDSMGLQALPRFGMSDGLAPDAWTHMRTIILTKGLLQTLDDGELSAVLAHELQHWRSGDAVGAHIVQAAAWPVALLYNFGSRLTGGSRFTFGGVFGWFIAWPAWVITRLVLVPLVSHTQRGYEYEADLAAARIGMAAQLASALRKMGAFEGGRSGWEQAMAATHPPTELRLEALQSPRPDDFEYQEEDLRVPTRQEVRKFLLGMRKIVVPGRPHQEAAVPGAPPRDDRG